MTRKPTASLRIPRPTHAALRLLSDKWGLDLGATVSELVRRAVTGRELAMERGRFLGTAAEALESVESGAATIRVFEGKRVIAVLQPPAQGSLAKAKEHTK